MSNLRRILTLVLVLLVPLGLSACAGDAGTSDPQDENVQFDEMDQDTIEIDTGAVDTLEGDTVLPETPDTNGLGS